MQTPEPHRTYTAADIERYHTGSMTPAEMHALERAALDDPFLADALDGYTYTQTPEADVALLRERLRRRTFKVIPLHRRRRLLWSAAAMLVLLAGLGWFFFGWHSTLQSFNNRSDVATRREAAPRSQPEAMPPASATDTMHNAPAERLLNKEPTDASANRSAATAPTENKDVAVVKAKQRSIGNTTNEIASGETSETVAASQPGTFSNPHIADAPALKQADKAMPQTSGAPSNNVFKARVIDSVGNPVPFATVMDMKQQRNVVQAGPEGVFIMTAPDSTLMVVVSATGFQSMRKKLDAGDTTATVALPRSEDRISEVVVTALGKKGPYSRVRLEAVEPRGSRKRLDAFAEENIEWPGAWEGALDENEVTLAFDIDKKGNAVNITVEKSLCAACDSTAVRIIREGAKWHKTSKGSKAKAHIRF